MKKTLINGPVPPQFIADCIARHAAKKEIGAHSMFLGQVRADLLEGKPVRAIEYTAYGEMAEKQFQRIREAAIGRYGLSCLHIVHSTGIVQAGELSLFVFASSPHRRACVEAVPFVVEEIKEKVPVFGRELLEDGAFVWKKNT